MGKKFTIVAWLLPLLFLTQACQEKKGATQQDLFGTWRLNYIEKTKRQSAQEHPMKSEVTEMRVVSDRIISIFADGKFARIGDKLPYEASYWKKNGNNNLSLTLNSYETVELIQKDTSYTLLLINTKEDTRMSYELEGKPMVNLKEDPFYPTNNIWREQTNASDTAIKFKLGNYLKHVSLILKASLERKADVVNFGYSKGLVSIYNGGIGIVDANQVPEEWQKSFADEAAAKKAYHLFEKVLTSGSYKGSSTADWVQDDYNILTSIYAQLKAL